MESLQIITNVYQCQHTILFNLKFIGKSSILTTLSMTFSVSINCFINAWGGEDFQKYFQL